MGLSSLWAKARRRSPGELARELGRRLRAASAFERRLGGRALAPYAVSFWVTRRCNLDCVMCWVAASKRAAGDTYTRADDELTLAELKSVVDDVARRRPRVGVTGGEPFLRRDVLDFLAHVKSRGLRCGVNTNGSFLSRDATALVDIGLDSIMVSVDGPPDVHDAVRRVPGAFVRVHEGVTALCAEKKRRGADIPHLKVTCAVSAGNVGRLAETPGLFADLPLDEFTFQHLWFTDRATADAQQRLFDNLFGQDTTYLQGFVADDVPPLDVKKLAADREKIRRSRYPFPVNFYPALNDTELAPFYGDPRARLRGACFSRWLRLDIMPDGMVTPCLGLNVGNVREKRLRAIWNGPDYKRFRAELAARRLFPGCNRCCGLFSD